MPLAKVAPRAAAKLQELALVGGGKPSFPPNPTTSASNAAAAGRKFLASSRGRGSRRCEQMWRRNRQVWRVFLFVGTADTG